MIKKLLLTTILSLGILSTTYAEDTVTAKPSGSFQIDYGQYLGNDSLESGFDFARRVKLGVKGTLSDNYSYNFILAADQKEVKLDVAWVSFNPDDIPVKFTLGVFTHPLGLARSTSGDDLSLLERPLVSNIAVDTLAGGKQFGAAAYYRTPTIWYGVSLADTLEDEQNTMSWNNRLLIRKTRTNAVIQGGLNYSETFEVDSNEVRWRDRPEIRVDGTSLVDSGTVTGVDSGYLIGAEALIVLGPLWTSGEYMWFGDSKRDYTGYYANLGYVLTGESRNYSTNNAVLTNITPENPIGAFEVVGRYSTVDLHTSNETNYTVGLNWYINEHVKVQSNLIYGEPSNSDEFTAVGVRLALKF